VGGYKPIIAEEGFKGDGYETEVKLEGDKVAYARMVAGDPPIVQIAVSKALMGMRLNSCGADGRIRGSMIPGCSTMTTILARMRPVPRSIPPRSTR
jgi:hypothetical protein